MDYIALLSQEHPELPRAELEAALEADGISAAVTDTGDGVAFVDGDGVEAVADRLALTFEISEHIRTFEPANYQKLAATGITAREPFAVRTVRVDDTAAPDELERNVGRIIDRNSDAAVELDHPEERFRVYLHGGEAHLCRLRAEVDRGQFEARKNQYRPYSSPVTIHPRLARAMVNLAGVPRDGAVLDPFCGTGGILLEAGLIGCDVYGSDVQEEMVDGAVENLDAFGGEARSSRASRGSSFEHSTSERSVRSAGASQSTDAEQSVRIDGDIREVDAADAATVFDRTFDAVVTDLPYGKASVTEGDPAETVRAVADELADGTAVFMSDDGAVDGLEPAFDLFVHRSMTRYVYVVD